MQELLKIRRKIKSILKPALEAKLPDTYKILQEIDEELLQAYLKITSFTEDKYIFQNGYPIPKLSHNGKGTQE